MDSIEVTPTVTYNTYSRKFLECGMKHTELTYPDVEHAEHLLPLYEPDDHDQEDNKEAVGRQLLAQQVHRVLNIYKIVTSDLIPNTPQLHFDSVSDKFHLDSFPYLTIPFSFRTA